MTSRDSSTVTGWSIAPVCPWSLLPAPFVSASVWAGVSAIVSLLLNRHKNSMPQHRCIPALLPLLLTGGHTAVWRRRDGAYRGTAPMVLARRAVCRDDASQRWLARCDARALLVRRIR